MVRCRQDLPAVAELSLAAVRHNAVCRQVKGGHRICFFTCLRYNYYEGEVFLRSVLTAARRHCGPSLSWQHCVKRFQSHAAVSIHVVDERAMR